MCKRCVINNIEELIKNDIKIEKVIVYQGSEYHRDELEGMLDMFGSDNVTLACGLSLGCDRNNVIEYFNKNYVGWLVAEVHSPIEEDDGSGPSLLWSWGTVIVALVVAPSVRELAQIAKEWAREEKPKLYNSLKYVGDGNE